MGREPHQLFRHVEPVGQECDLLRQPLGIGFLPVEQLPHRAPQPLPLGAHPLGSARVHPLQTLTDQVEPAHQLLQEDVPFPSPHGEHAVQGPVHDREHHSLRRLVQRECLARRIEPEHLGLAGDELEVDGARQVERGPQFFQCRQRSARAREVHTHGRGLNRLLHPARRNAHVAALEVTAQVLAQRLLHRLQRDGQAQLDVEVSVIDRANLDLEPTARDRAVRHSEAGHGAGHRDTLPSGLVGAKGMKGERGAEVVLSRGTSTSPRTTGSSGDTRSRARSPRASGTRS
jgi:hypothetical protein